MMNLTLVYKFQSEFFVAGTFSCPTEKKGDMISLKMKRAKYEDKIFIKNKKDSDQLMKNFRLKEFFPIKTYFEYEGYDIEDKIDLGEINFHFYDFNFDGNLDFTIPINSSWRKYYLYNPSNNIFKNYKDCSKIVPISFASGLWSLQPSLFFKAQALPKYLFASEESCFTPLPFLYNPPIRIHPLESFKLQALL